ncbi:hypothetical protein [Sphingomonas sp. GM_Shp_2]|uniref:hypothetical protein n=1 Tax=Sphingomonas sp. GM_Shp_2 TaxID=2937380 RepID=UPI00226A65DA|nr:hypothetical protein [Sphingomonas sp. GM_Shp_2]
MPLDNLMSDYPSLQWIGGAIGAHTFKPCGNPPDIRAASFNEPFDVVPETQFLGARWHLGHAVNLRRPATLLSDLRLAFGVASLEQTFDNHCIDIATPRSDTVGLIRLQTDQLNNVTTLSAAFCESP